MSLNPTRRRFLTAVGGAALLGVAQPASASFTPGTVGTAPYLPGRLFPTMGTDPTNPTAVVYVDFTDEKCLTFAQGNLEDIVDEYVRPGLLNVEVRFSVDVDDEGATLVSRAAHGAWDLEPENFWSFFEFAYWNFTTRTYTERRVRNYLRLGGVRNYGHITNQAAEGKYQSLVRAAVEEADRFGIGRGVTPRVRMLRDIKAGNYYSLLDWMQTRLDRFDDMTRSTHSLLPGTKYETPVHVLETGRPGPTAVVVGGMHGDEPEGYTTAERIAQLRVTGGKLVVIPRANRPAIEIGARYTEDGDLNRQFPTGRAPTTALARAIWDEVSSHDPDVVVDLHSARGIYKYDSSVGQAIFPTVPGASEAAAACDLVNDYYLDGSGYPSYYDFDRGNYIDGSKTLLMHKVYGELGLPGYLVETTRRDTEFEDCLVWEFAAARDVLDRNGCFLV